MKGKILIIVLLAWIIQVPAKAQDTCANSCNTLKCLNASNLWLHTGNSAGLAFLKRNVLLAETGVERGEGDFRRIMEGNRHEQYFFKTESYNSLLSKVFIYGQFNYRYKNDYNGRYSGVYDPYRGNPYILGDSVSGTRFHREEYLLKGHLGYKINDRMLVGMGLNYHTGTGAKQKDPRPETLFTFFSFTPSWVYNRPTFRLGVDGVYGSRKEQISYSTRKTNFNPTFFMFKGMGFHFKELGSDYTRFYDMQDFSGGLQFEKQMGHFTSLSEVRAGYSLEGVNDGSSVIRKEDGGDWNVMTYSASQQLKLDVGAVNHLLRFTGSFKQGKGTEYLQKIVNQGNYEEYITISKNLKFTRDQLNAGLFYQVLSGVPYNRITWNLTAGADFLWNEETYYYTPEVFSSSFTQLIPNVLIERNFYKAPLHFLVSAEAAYKYTLNKSLNLSDAAEIAKTQLRNVYQQEFNYYTADALITGGGLTVGYMPGDQAKVKEIYLKSSANYIRSNMKSFDYWFVEAKVGIVF